MAFDKQGGGNTVRGLIAAACFGVLGWAGPTLAADWKTIDESQSRLYVAAVPDPQYAETGWNESYTSRAYRAVQADRTPSDPRAEIYYFELAPGRFFPALPRPADQVVKFNYLKSGFTASGDEGYFARGLRMRYLTGRRANRSCVVFVGGVGDGAGDGQTSAGTAYTTGYYCEPAERPLDARRTEEVLASIGLKEVGKTAPARFTDRPSPKASVPASTGQASTGQTSSGQPSAGRTSAAGSDTERSLLEAKRLYEKKLITEGEYEAMRKKVLGLN